MTIENPIHRKLEASRRDLLDLTTRNRLIHTARSSTRSGRLEIVDEISAEVFRTLVAEGKAMTFLPANTTDETDPQDHQPPLFQPPEEGLEPEDEQELADRHIDLHLQTALNDESLQKRLLKLYYDARTFEEEQGVNILYLALGFLKWYEDDNSDRERFAPLLLLPVQLDRRSASSRFRLRYNDDDVTTNLSLQEKLRADFGLKLPEVPPIEDLDVNRYFSDVAHAIESKPRWNVLQDDIVLWFFSFSKFLMYRDLQPENWPEERQIASHSLVRGLLEDGFVGDPPICTDDDHLDQFLQPLDMIHVMDADSSQALAIEEVRRGRNLVIQGPPGTGKSQTIANLIATAVKEDQRVLFVAEKMAALEVVKRRLDNVGLGDMCLELHSNKANKRAVLDELSRTLKLGRPKVGDVQRQAEDLAICRDQLNRHAEVLHSPLQPAELTPYQVLGELVRLRAHGVEPVDFKMQDCLAWSALNMRERRRLLIDLTIHMREIGNPAEHAWRGVRLEGILPMDVARLASELPPIRERLQRLLTGAERLAEITDQPFPESALALSNLAQIGRRLAKAPPMDREAITDSVWETHRSEIDEVIKQGHALSHCQKALADTVGEVGWSTDVSQVRRDLAAHGQSWLRIFKRPFRDAQSTLRGILICPLPKPLEERIQVLDDLIRGQKAQQLIESDQSIQEVASRAFGNQWRGGRSDWSALADISSWEADCRESQMPDNIRNLVAQVDDPAAIGAFVKAVGRDLKPLLVSLQDLFTRLLLDVPGAFGTTDIKRIPLRELADRLAGWETDPESLTKWIAYYVRWKSLEIRGMGALADQLDDGLIAADEALNAFLMAYHEELMRESFRRFPELARFDGASHEQILMNFKKLDAERLTMARQEVAMAHFAALPTHSSDIGELGVLRKQMKLKRRHLPLRKLLQQAGHAIQAVKPVFMMSPISIAQYLEPGVLEFDLLVFDEASQVTPVDALGAIARARQVVVVGDDRQLPPTRFFSRVADDAGDEASDADDFQTADVESVLGLCEAQNMPQRMLRWHYRSRHHSLIAVSNREFYDDRLYVVPSPVSGAAGGGLIFRHIDDGTFDRGGSATNRKEAQAIADAVMDHARRYPDKTLGVGAFSVAQRDAILDELELRRRQASGLEPFFATGSAEPFFVKNLENIQGDERAVIFISVGYGRDASGYMAMSFGPLNNDGGERRLNVLITRARERCEVFSSITADDIDLGRTRARGTRALKTFLTYARSGFLDIGEPTDREYDSEFEREVARAITACGVDVHSQVGVAGFFVDLAIVDPECPGRYLLGIECDGATYHSSRSARDRDRLRQQVLEDRGWTIHRIWSTDWFHRPEEQLRKVMAAMEQAKMKLAVADESETKSLVSEGHVPDCQEFIDRDTAEVDLSVDQAPVESVPYLEASFQVRTSQELHEVAPELLSRVVMKIVDIEGPVHLDEIARRAATIWGLQRTGSRISSVIESALAIAVDEGEAVQTGLFFQSSGLQEVPIRNRKDVYSRNLRKPEYLPPLEIRSAITAVVATNLGIQESELVKEVARLFGFRSTSSQLRQLLEDEIRALVDDEVIDCRNLKFYTGETSMAAGTR
jgi:very-short-patch-repair endonuclease/DNA polymerase III delta prime subunit